jgi:CheY-like chemotaxis protein
VNLLVVDDDHAYRSLLSEILTLQGHLVHTAADGAEAYQIIQTEEIDLVVSDIRMPRIDGVELHKLLRQDQRHRSLPFVYFSGYLDHRTGNVIQDPEVDFFVQKGEPFGYLSQLINTEAAKRAELREKPAQSNPRERFRKGSEGLFPILDY